MSAPFWIVLGIVLVLAVAALAAVATGRLTLGVDAPAGQAPLHPVLLPEDPTAADVHRVRLATAVPGYQRDQVDEVLVRLQDALARREARVAELEALLARQGEATEAAAPAGALADDVPGAAFGEAVADPR